MQAELYRVTGKGQKAAEYYDKAIKSAREHEFLYVEALANELAAKFYMRNDRDELAEFYFQKAWQVYRKWGATAKLKHLEERYPKYMRQPTYASMRTTGTLSASSTDTSSTSLDVNTILKATQTLSGEVQLKSLLEKMMQILIENAGAQKSLLLENTGEGLLIQAEGSTDGVSGILQALPVDESDKVPLAVINYVARSKQKLVFDNISKDPNYSTDHYIQKNQTKSVVCFPILSKGELSAIIYLENNLVEGAFTPARLEILNMLSAQIAISVENTRLYENLEEKVKQRTIALQKAHQQLEKNHQALEESHKKISDSVNYASRIQNAVLPGQETLATLLPQHFILYRPCAGVSGDFYWVRLINQKIIAAAADCTGHGVPGALVSMLGTALLNEIVPYLAAQFQFTPGNILDELRTEVKTALKQIGQISDQKEGMDISLCIIDPLNKQLQYAGAYHPLYLIRDNQLTEVKGDKMPIGIHRKEQPFTSHNIPFQKGDMIYLFSDGFVDQFSEKKKEKFMRRNFKKLLIEINQEPVSKQKEQLISRLEEWKGNLAQVDDILIFGIRL
jgi:serine phosphatase RsbU (regulator of sigma subunit)